MIDVNSSIVELLSSGMKKEIHHEEFCAMLGSAYDEEKCEDHEFEVSGVRAPNAIRYTIKDLDFVHATKVFAPDVEASAVRQWVIDEIQKVQPKLVVELV